MVAILGYSREQIFSAVKDMYTAVARSPSSHFHFPVGSEASRALGYPPEQVEALPQAIRQSFAGVGYPFHGAAVRPGDTVLDIGAGAGNDALIASRLAGPEGHVLALDLTPAMTRKLQEAAGENGYANVHVMQASAEQLPLADGSVDSITTNGALNLVPDKWRAVTEMHRVLRPGGRLQIADVVIRRPVTVDCSEDPRLWVECVVGATIEDDLITMFRDAGFEDIRVLREVDYFAHSPSAQTREVAASFDARSIELGMRRGAREPSRAVQWMKRLNPWRLLVSMWRRGITGVAGLAMALLVCYGGLLAMGLLALLGIGLTLNEGVWAGAIAAFAALAAVGVAAGFRRHGSVGPPVFALAGLGVILYALFVDYSMAVEFSGFVLLAGAAARDLQLRRRHEAGVLGLESSAA